MPPATEPASALPVHTPDIANGKYMFTAGGCAECHAVPVKKCDDLKANDKVTLAGGRCLKTPYGTFHVPNISPDKETGIGNWTTIDFVNAMKHGVAPDGSYLYPAFPFGSYQRMSFEDLIDLKAYLDSLPAVKNEVPPHELGFPFNIRRGLGLWHKLYVNGESFVPDPHASAELNRGAYLVTGPGHCTECHSSRNLLGGIVKDTEFAGAPKPEGKGSVPNITPSDDGIGDWSEDDIAYLLETGNTPDFDVIGESMARRCKKTWRSSWRRIARPSPPISSRCRRVPTPCPNRSRKTKTMRREARRKAVPIAARSTQTSRNSGIEAVRREWRS